MGIDGNNKKRLVAFFIPLPPTGWCDMNLRHARGGTVGDAQAHIDENDDNVCRSHAAFSLLSFPQLFFFCYTDAVGGGGRGIGQRGPARDGSCKKWITFELKPFA